MNIVLIGMRGSGKTAVGKILARRLGKEFVEMDGLIVRRAGLSIPEIVEKYGWRRFRDMEEEIACEVAGLDNVVTATGGGVVTRERSIRELKEGGKLIWLKTSVDSLLKRIGDDPERPPLVSGRSNLEDLEIALAQRRLLYQQAADFVVDTEGKTPEEVAEAIAILLQNEASFND